MRRRAAALGLGLILLLAGCANGDITQSWGPMPAAKQFRPEAGTCHATLDDTAEETTADEYKPVPCSGPHKAETVAVLDLSAAETASTTPWINSAYTECTKKVNAWLGGDYRTGWTVIHPLLPSSAAQSGGARWIRCDVGEMSPIDRTAIERKGTMKGSLKPGGKLLMTCANTTIGSDDGLDEHPVSCASKHDTEFAGLYVSAKKEYSDFTRAEMDKGCSPVLARFAGVPNNRDLEYRVGWVAFQPDEHAWSLGDHAMRCFLWFAPRKVTGSYRKAGTGKLAIQYAN